MAVIFAESIEPSGLTENMSWELETGSWQLFPRHIPIHTPGAEPPIGVRLELDLVVAVLAGTAVVGPEQIDEQASPRRADRNASRTRFVGEVVEHDQRMLAPRV